MPPQDMSAKKRRSVDISHAGGDGGGGGHSGGGSIGVGGAAAESQQQHEGGGSSLSAGLTAPMQHPHQQQQQQYPCVDCPLFPFESGTLQKILDPKAADWDGFAKSVGDVNEPMKERDVFRRIRYMLGRSCLGQDLLVVHACDDTTRHLAHHLIDQRGMAAAAGAIVIGRKPSPGREGRAE
uniref:Uncharacterized protein n=1 Tax=Vitrella brassicaformis TaxID=1169539 RepID=A0A7S1KFC5_9ALVE